MHLDSVIKWVDVLYSRSPGYLSIVSTSNWAGRCFPNSQTGRGEALKYVKQLDQADAAGIYARVTTLHQIPTEGRGGDEDSLSLPGLWADMDLAGPGHKTAKTLPNDIEDCKRILDEAELPDPTLWVHSGGGVYPWWLFEDPWPLITPEERANAYGLSKLWHDAIAAAAQRLGFHYGPVPDLSRVLRIPGTVNRKIKDNPRPCEILEDQTSGGLYPLLQVVEWAGIAEAALKRHASASPAYPTPPANLRLVDGGEAVGNRPGDRLAAHSWDTIMRTGGFQEHSRRGGETYWTRPGKDVRDGLSATTNYAGSDLLWVFSTECEGFDPNESYTKFAAWSILNKHGRDWGAAARDILVRTQGATERNVDILRGILGEDYTSPPSAPPAEPTEVPARPKRPYDLTDTGNGHRLRDFFGHKYRWVEDYKSWMRYDGKSWKRDRKAAVTQAAEACTELMWDEVDELERNLDETDDKAVKHVEAFRRHVKNSRSDRGIKAAVSRFSSQRGIAMEPEDFDKKSNLLTVQNGVLDLNTYQLHGHSADFMLTRTFGAEYSPDAQCPKWMKFLEQVLPNPEVRAYVQRAMGYTLLGEADRRVMFLLYGPSGTGKSQFTEALAYLFKDFGQTAAASTFRKKHGNASATNDLHGLKGKRLITSSETSETSELDEELLKRFTGRDQVTSRDLYEKFQSWVPEGIVWLTTNYLPKLSSDDNAVWMRVKPIEFSHVFAGTVEDQPNIGVRIAEEEAAGILNWLLEGVSGYRSHGLQEPQQVTQSSADHRRESDNVAQFLEEALDDGLLIRQEGANDLKVALVFDRYEHWCKQNRIAPLGIRRFNQRLTSHGLFKERRGGYYYWLGLKVNDAHGFLGTMT